MPDDEAVRTLIRTLINTRRKVGTATWDPGVVADGALTSTTVTVTGATLGSPCAVGFSIAVPAGAQLTADVTAANTVTVKLRNQTGAPLDLASGTVTVHAWVT